MTYDIGVYKAERDAGLEQIIRASASIVTASLLRIADKQDLSPRALASVKNNTVQRSTAGLNDFDLHYLDTILVSTGWNKNKDVFDVTETWLARATPQFKAINFNHCGTDIIGTMISSKAVTVEGIAIADDTVVDDLPSKLHLITGGVLWKVWEDKDKQERMDRILAEIAKSEYFVSMECLFKHFDYALQSETDGTTRVVARNDQSAFLSKKLQVYGGTGKYGQYTVGRVLRNITFSGKGIVKNPANPESIIIDPNNDAFLVTKTEASTDISQLLIGEVYSTSATIESPTNSTQELNTMAVEVTVLEKQLEAARAEIDTLKASLKENDIKAIQATASSLTAELAATKAELVKFTTLAADEAKAALAAKAEVVTLTKNVEELTKTEAEIRLELKTIYAEKTKAERLAKLATAMNVDPTDVEAFKSVAALNEALGNLTPDQFAAYLTATAAVAPKATPAPLPPKATPAPLPPLAGKASTSEEDDPAASNANTALLDGAKANKTEPNLQTVSPSDGVTKLSKSIAAFCGIAEETK